MNALPKKIITQKLDGRVRTWGGANGGCPKGEAAAEARADDLLSVASTADKKLDESTKHVTVREATLSMPSHLLHIRARGVEDARGVLVAHRVPRQLVP